MPAVAVFVDGGGAATATASWPPAVTLANGWRYEQLSLSVNTQHYIAYIRIANLYLVIWGQGGYGVDDVLLVGGGLALTERADQAVTGTTPVTAASCQNVKVGVPSTVPDMMTAP